MGEDGGDLFNRAKMIDPFFLVEVMLSGEVSEEWTGVGEEEAPSESCSSFALEKGFLVQLGADGRQRLTKIRDEGNSPHSI